MSNIEEQFAELVNLDSSLGNTDKANSELETETPESDGSNPFANFQADFDADTPKESVEETAPLSGLACLAGLTGKKDDNPNAVPPKNSVQNHWVNVVGVILPSKGGNDQLIPMCNFPIFRTEKIFEHLLNTAFEMEEFEIGVVALANGPIMLDGVDVSGGVTGDLGKLQMYYKGVLISSETISDKRGEYIPDGETQPRYREPGHMLMHSYQTAYQNKFGIPAGINKRYKVIVENIVGFTQ